jgi:RNA polymerase sigma-70 factor (ECF subfamily)
MTPDAPALDPSAYAPVIRNALRRLGVPTHSIDDAMQDVFTVVVRRDGDFDRGRSLTNWLWGIARGVASTHRRTRARRARLHDALRSERAPCFDAEDHVAREEATRRIESFVAGLSPVMREVFVLAHVHGHSGPEVAEQLGINLNTAYARIRATRLRFEAEVIEPQRGGLAARVMRVFAPWFAATSKSVATATLSASLVWVGAATPRATVAAPTEDVDDPIVIVDDLAEPRMPARPAKDAVMPIKTIATAALAVAIVAPPTVATAAPAKAKPAAAAPADDGDPDSAARRTEGDKTYYDFVEGDRAEGIVLKPTGENLGAHGRIKFGSLITIRSHFMPELVRTARDL